MRDLIDRAEAIDLANELYQGMDIIQATYNDVRKAIVAFINLVPSAQPTQTNTSNTLESLDCISRQAAIDAIHNADTQIYEGEAAVGRRNYMTKEECCEIIDGLPSAQPDRSLWFRIGEICVDESKGFITAGRAFEKIRELLREAERRTDDTR